jgi:hypothetical protein
MAATRRPGDGSMGDRAGCADAGASRASAVGRHERRRHLVDVSEHRATPAEELGAGNGTRATRASQSQATRATQTGQGRAGNGTRATRAGRLQAVGPRAARSRHAARPGWAAWVERARRMVAEARTWWNEGTERVAARDRERWAGRATGRLQATTGRPATDERDITLRPVDGPRRETIRRSAAATDATPQRTRSSDPAANPTPQRTRSPDPAAPRHLAGAGRSRRLGEREDVVTAWCSALLVAGLYLDGWGAGWGWVLYAGFLATATWVLVQGRWSLRAVPAGYRLGLFGMVLAMVAVAGDGLWHLAAGEAQGAARLVAPFHLVLLAGAGLLAGSSLRAAWSGPGPARVPGLRAYWPVLASATLLVAMAAWGFQEVSPVLAWRRPEVAVVGLLVHNLLFVAPVLGLLLRWQTPLGTFTVLAGSVSLLLATQTGLGLVGLVGAAVLGGAAADVAVHLLRPSPQRRWAARAAAGIAPAVCWSAHFGLLAVGYGVTTEPATWLASVVWASLSGLALAVLMWPPALPLTAWNRGRAQPARSPVTPVAMPARMVGR